MADVVIMPKLTDEMETGTVSEWLRSEGETVEMGQPLFSVETDKATTEVPAERDGTLLRILVEAGHSVPVGTALAWIGSKAEDLLPGEQGISGVKGSQWREQELTGVSHAATSIRIEEGDVLASPAARRLARELGVELGTVLKRGGHRHVSEADVRAFAEARQTKESHSPTLQGWGQEARNESVLVGMTPWQHGMAIRMAQSAAIPQFATVVEVNFAKLEEARAQMFSGWEKDFGIRLTYTQILAALVSRVLKDSPLNSRWTPEGIRLFRNVNLGVAMATSHGLVVPVVHEADQRSLKEIAIELTRLRTVAEQNRLLPQDLGGGTFTFTSVGMMGVSLSIPALNPPQAGILAIAARQDRLALRDGQLVSMPVVAATLVADHRIVDGAMAAGFLRQLKEQMESLASVIQEGPSHS